MEGVQHNTYDVEFYGPNPMCGIYYLGALRAARRDGARRRRYALPRRSTEICSSKGSRWIDANLFNGEFYIQKVRGFRKDEIANNLRSDMGSENTETPEYQVGDGCLADQLIGQYLAEIGGIGPAGVAGEYSHHASLHLQIQLPADSCRITTTWSAPMR